MDGRLSSAAIALGTDNDQPRICQSLNQEVFWDGLREGLINTVATDHAPFDFSGQKAVGETDFTKIPNGIPSLEERIKLLYTYGVNTGRLDLQTFVNVASTQIAKLYSLFSGKGAIQPGADADLVVFDPDYRGTISAKTQLMKVNYSAFEGWKVEGCPSVVQFAVSLHPATGSSPARLAAAIF